MTRWPHIVGIHFQRSWNLPLMAILLALFIYLFLRWNRPTRIVVGRIWAGRLLLLRAMAALCLLLFCFNPTLVYLKGSREREKLAVVLDASQSMNQKDAGGEISRLESVRKLLREKSLASELEEIFDPVYFAFDREARILPDGKVDSLEAEGGATDICGLFRLLAENAPEKGWNAAILFTDGCENVPGDTIEAARSPGCPIYTVGIGEKAPSGGEPLADAGIVRYETNPWAVQGEVSPLHVLIGRKGFEGESATLRLESGDEILAEKSIVLSKQREQETALEFTPGEKGLFPLRLSIIPPPGDAIPENNVVEFTLPVTEDRMKILYLEGTLRWEYKFLRKTLLSDPYLEPAFLIRTSADNVFRQQGGDFLKNGLPDDLEKMEQIEAVILGDMPRAFLSDQQLQTLDRFVSEKGGGLIVTGGFHTLCSGEYRDSPLSDLLPVKLVPGPRSAETAAYRFHIPVRAAGHEILKGLSSELEKPAFEKWHPTGDAKPGAEILAKRRTASGDEGILLAVQTYGKGRVVFINTDEFWRFGLTVRQGGKPAPTRRLYLQALRWCSGRSIEEDKDAPLFFPRLDRVYYEPGSNAKLEVKWNESRTGDLQASLEGALLFEGKEEAALDFSRSASGDAAASFKPVHSGFYEVRLEGRAGDRKETQTLKFLVGRPFQELESVSLNETLLRAVAGETGGGYFSQYSAKEIPRLLEQRELKSRERVERELAGGVEGLAVFLLLAGLEWYIRRRKGLM